MRRAMCAAAALCALWATASAGAQSVGSIAGRITIRPDSGQPVPAVQAQVTIDGSSRRATSTTDGRYLIEAVSAGQWTVRVRAVGARVATRDVIVAAGDTVRVDFVVERAVQLLAPIRADAQSAEDKRFET